MGVLLQTMAGRLIMNKMADIYWGSVSKQLNRFGLRYEDILVETPEVREALRRLSPEAKEGRSQRYRRAIDLSFKKHYLPETIQALLEHQASGEGIRRADSLGSDQQQVVDIISSSTRSTASVLFHWSNTLDVVPLKPNFQSDHISKRLCQTTIQIYYTKKQLPLPRL